MAIKLTEKQIKDGWQIVKFGDIAKEVKLTTKNPAEDGLEFYVGLDHLDPQSLRIARKGIIAEDNPSFTRRFSAGQILFGKRRCYQKKAAVAGFEGICSGDIIVMDATPKKIIPGLLPFIIQSDAFFDWAEKTSSGSLSPRTKWKSLAEFEFPLPPIERQKEILEVLEKLEECLNSAEKTSIAGQYAQTRTMNELINRLIDDSPRKKLSELGITFGGLSGKKGSDFGKSGKPYITYLNIYNNFEIDPNGVDLVSIKPKEKQNQVKKGDVLFTISSETPDEVGISSVMTEELGEVYLNSFCFGFRLSDSSKFFPKYLKYFFRSSYFRQAIRRLAQGSTRYNLSKSEFLKISIPILSDNQQIEVCDSLETFSEINSNINDKINELSKIKSSTLDSIFNNNGGVQ
jgi:type I restriction enzyme, S subunit